METGYLDLKKRKRGTTKKIKGIYLEFGGFWMFLLRDRDLPFTPFLKHF